MKINNIHKIAIINNKNRDDIGLIGPNPPEVVGIITNKTILR